MKLNFMIKSNRIMMKGCSAKVTIYFKFKPINNSRKGQSNFIYEYIIHYLLTFIIKNFL